MRSRRAAPSLTANVARSFFTLALSTVHAACDCEGGGSLSPIPPKIAATPSPLEFGGVAPENYPWEGSPVAQAKRLIHVRNTGGGNLHILSIGFEEGSSPTFVVLDAPPESALPFELRPEEEQRLTIRFTPVDLGVERASLVITSDDPEQPQLVVPISGTLARRDGPSLAVCVENEALGVARRCLDPLAIDFGELHYGETASARIILRSDGTVPVEIGSARARADADPAIVYEPAELSGALSPGEMREVQVRFIPEIGDNANSAYEIRSNDASRNIIRVESQGVGLNPPGLCLTPVPVDFGEVRLGRAADRDLEISNCGDVAFDIESVEVAGASTELTIALPLPTPIHLEPSAPGRKVHLRYAPVDEGVDRARLRVSTSIGEGYVPLIAQGGSCRLSALPETLTFVTALGTTDTRSLLLENTGYAPCEVSSIRFTPGTSPELSIASSSPFSSLVLGSGDNTSVDVTYAPTDLADDAGEVEIMFDDPTVLSVRVFTSARATADGVCRLEISPTSLNLGRVQVGTSRARAVELENVSTESCEINAVTLDPSSSSAFSARNNTLGVIYAGEKRDVAVTYRPTSSSTATGTLVIETSSLLGTTFRVPLVASGRGPEVCVEPRQIAFGQTLTATSAAFTVRACGPEAVMIGSVDFSVTDPEIRITNPPALPMPLASGQAITLEVQYQPRDASGDTAAIVVRSNDVAEPAIEVTVTGGPELAPLSAGRSLYYWQIGRQGDVMRLPLQGVTTPEPYWGPRVGKRCTGCHTLSPDGHYVGVVESGAAMKVIDTETNAVVPLSPQVTNALYVSWNPNVNTDPPYQFAYSDGFDVRIASLDAGYMGALAGASDPLATETMPSWGPNGHIAFVRANGSGGLGVSGTSDLMTVDAQGGLAVLVPGASNNAGLNYYPAYSPNGAFIAYTFSASGRGSIASDDARVRLVRTNASGTMFPLEDLNSVPGDGGSSYPTWSKDGSLLSFSSNRSGGAGGWDIYIAPIDPDTGTDGPAKNLVEANSPGFDHAARWSPR